MTKARLVGLGMGIILILVAFGLVLWQSANMPSTNTALAQGGSTATPVPVTPVPGAAPAQQAIGDNFWALLAGKLGVNADTLKAQAVQTRQEMIDQAVKDGRLTQAQADAIKQRINSNNLIAPIPLPRGPQQNIPQRGGPFFGQHPFSERGFGGGFGGGLGGLAVGGGLEYLNAVAAALKLEPKALVAQLAQDKTLADIAKAQGVDEATVKQVIISTRTAQIDQLLSLGLISQVQADQLKSRLTPDNIDLSRGFPFQFRPSTAPKTSELDPSLEPGESFNQDFNAFGDSNGGFLYLPFGDVQTQ